MVRSVPQSAPATPHWHRAFLQMLPVIVTHARISFRHFNPETRQEAVQEAICNACCAYARLFELGRTSIAYPMVLARYAVAQVNDGRKVGGRRNVRDVSSWYAQQQKCFVVERLDHFDKQEGAWREILVEDRRATAAEVTCVRLDFEAWLRTLPRREKRIAETLATGETVTATARKFSVTTGRISQIRSELWRAWEQFQGELVGQVCPAAA